MAKSTRVNTKPARKRPPVTGTLVGVRLQPEELEALDAWCAAHDDPKPTRQDAMREALRQLVRKGIGKPKR